MRASALVPLALSSMLACDRARHEAATPAPPAPPDAAPLSSAPPPPAEDGDEEKAPPAPAAVAKLGALHLPPLYIDSGAWLALQGTKEGVHFAWIVKETGEAERINEFPSGVKAVTSVRHQGSLYLLLETLAVLDQPAGLRTVIRVTPDDKSLFGSMVEPDLASAADDKELKRRIKGAEKRPDPFFDPPFSERLTKGAVGSVDARLTVADIAPFLADDGAQVGHLFQGIFLKPLGERVTAKNLASSPHASVVVDLMTGLLWGSCDGPLCIGGMSMGAPSFGSIRVDTKGRVLGVYSHQYPGPAASSSPSAPLASGPLSSETRALLGFDVQGAEQPTFGAQAPLGAGGTVAVASTPTGLISLFVQGSFASVVRVSLGRALEARFVDVDGDGLPDAVVRGESANGGPKSRYTRVFLSPRTVNPRPLDRARDFAMLGAKNLDAAIKAASAVPNRGVRRADVCGALAKAATAADLRSISAPGAALVTFEGVPGEPLESPKIIPFSRLKKDEAFLPGERCHQLYCDHASPFCESVHPGPSSEYYVFQWSKSGPKLLFLGQYMGSLG